MFMSMYVCFSEIAVSILIISVSGSGADQSALCCCNHRFVLVLFMLHWLPQCAAVQQKFMSHTNT